MKIAAARCAPLLIRQGRGIIEAEVQRMSNMAFEQYAEQIDFMQVFQLEILRSRIDEALKRRKRDEDAFRHR